MFQQCSNSNRQPHNKCLNNNCLLFVCSSYVCLFVFLFFCCFFFVVFFCLFLFLFLFCFVLFVCLIDWFFAAATIKTNKLFYGTFKSQNPCLKVKICSIRRAPPQFQFSFKLQKLLCIHIPNVESNSINLRIKQIIINYYYYYF